ncbi:7-carboxy-7-deazaguanine synthase [Rubripirellula tenax]|uniref:7-carboxy-7-deazaguanine synthase n=1 Tax=Rubripirellula tenax TaxID=2528015 RepID=A0A5C6FFA7_9BACT|nr:7-carboxy-7-deazaguanine synthase QueE [Rubripirellula tenax]TWU60191.1 7-carboxy-7-deazaguanine synthase [Rubripirellula tenax]
MTSTGEIRFSHGIGGPTRGSDDGAPAATLGLRIAETFVSRQGEGKLTGVESFFVRTSGCNLRCWFCDTPYASWKPEGPRQTVSTIVDSVLQSGISHVVLTGGEPLLPDACVSLCQQLRDAGLHITIETAGTIDRDVPCDLMSISPKLSASAPDAGDHPQWHQRHHDRRMPIDLMRRLIDRSDDFQVKFVIDSPAEFDECAGVVESLQVRPDDIWIMPQGVSAEAMDTAATWLKPWCESAGYRFCDRMHLRWYGNRRGT